MRRKRRSGFRLLPTAHQTTGPFFPAQYIREGDNDLARRSHAGPAPRGERIYLHGHVRDNLGAAAVNVIVEIWQADAGGRFAHPADPAHAAADPNFFGWGRTWTDRKGFYAFTTIKPGPYQAAPGSNRWFAPRIGVQIVGSGLMRPLVTYVYFPGEALNDEDPQLRAIRDVRARRRLVAVPEPHVSAPSGMQALRYDIFLGGREASTFLED